VKNYWCVWEEVLLAEKYLGTFSRELPRVHGRLGSIKQIGFCLDFCLDNTKADRVDGNGFATGDGNSLAEKPELQSGDLPIVEIWLGAQVLVDRKQDHLPVQTRAN
jgi:hypothetical protein